ncbi:MAG: PIG-L family deacetylase, partial [Bacteroidia bacterium]
MAQGGFGYRPGWTRDQIREEIRGLGVDGSVLYIAAHPDDENTRFLAFMARHKRWRTGYLSLTRGDGGQNLIGDHTEYDLGIIRTQELLAARRVDGAEQFFTRANDFGFSKNPEETWQHWDREKVLADVVWVIRLFKPRLLVTRFSPLPAATHGHHTASA